MTAHQKLKPNTTPSFYSFKTPHLWSDPPASVVFLFSAFFSGSFVLVACIYTFLSLSLSLSGRAGGKWGIPGVFFILSDLGDYCSYREMGVVLYSAFFSGNAGGSFSRLFVCLLACLLVCLLRPAVLLVLMLGRETQQGESEGGSRMGDGWISRHSFTHDGSSIGGAADRLFGLFQSAR